MSNLTSEDGVSLWQDEAKCRDLVNTEEFFERTSERAAKKFCRMCPVQGDCLEYALVYDTYGVWGGLSYKERKRKYPASYRSILREDYKDSGLYNEALKN